jgi:hypothetical protein
MRTETYVHNNVWHLVPTILITEDGPAFLSVDFVWLKWGFSIIIKDTISKYDDR